MVSVVCGLICCAGIAGIEQQIESRYERLETRYEYLYDTLQAERDIRYECDEFLARETGRLANAADRRREVIDAALDRTVSIFVCDKTGGIFTKATGYFVRTGVVFSAGHVFDLQSICLSAARYGMQLTEDDLVVVAQHYDSDCTKWVKQVDLNDPNTIILTNLFVDRSADVGFALADSARWFDFEDDDLDVDTYLGEPVFTIGNPAGFSHTLSYGYVASQTTFDFSDDGLLEAALSLDLNIMGGNSGGAVIDLDGNVVGIISCTYSAPTGGMRSFAAPIASFLKHYDAWLLSTGIGD
jgi:hypothetical protein